MIKYLIVYILKYKKFVGHNSFVWEKEIKNCFFFCDGLPSYSEIIAKIMKNNNCDYEYINIINILPIKPEPNDLETKEVIKI